MRIAYFTDTFSPQINGVANTLNHLSKYLKQKGHEQLFFAPDYDTEHPDDPSIPVMRFKGIRPYIYPECSLAFPPHAKAVEALSEFKPDVVHVVTEVGVGFAGLRAAQELKLPIVMSYHTNFDQYLDSYNLKYLSLALWTYMKWFHNQALVNLCPSRNTMQYLAQQGVNNLAVWSRGIDAGRFNPGYYAQELRQTLLGGDNKLIFLYVGRIAKEKGLETLVKSIRIFNQQHQDKASFVFTREGPYLEELQAGQIPNAIFTGAKHGRELSVIYASADAFLFPSGTETFGNVALEAMASGLPLVCVGSGGVTDFTTHQENAFVCSYNNALSFAQGMLEMLNPRLRAKIRQGALATAKSRSWESIFDGLMRHYVAAAQAGSAPQGMVG